MSVPTIEEFIERSKLNCRISAGITVRRRYAERMRNTVSDEEELKRLAEEYLNTDEGRAECEAALEAGSFYRQLCAQNAAEQPKVRSAYKKYADGIEASSAGKAERRQSRNRRRKNNRKQKQRSRHEEYFALYREYEFTEEDAQLAVRLVCDAVGEYYSDIRNILNQKFIKDIYSEFANESLLGRLMRRLYDEASLNNRRIDNVVYMSELPCGDLSDVFFYIAAVRVLEGAEFGENSKRKLIRDFVAQGRAGYMFLPSVYRKIATEYDRDRLTAVITGGAEYKKAVAYIQTQIKMSESAHELILKEIPEDVTQLYPGARGMHRHFILHLGPTNSGKTYQSLEACKKAETGVYLAPLRLLAYEICEKFNLEGVPCRMITGEETIDIPFATHTSSTVEMLNTNEHYDVAVVDECQLIEDEERGGAWTAAILGLKADEIHLCASENAMGILVSLIDLCGDSYETVTHERSVPLKCDKRNFTFPKDVEPKDALIAFTKKGVLHYANILKSVGIRASVIYGDLPYDVRRSEVSRFTRGETEVVVATDAVGMGLNLPIKRVVFLEAYKFDGRRRRFLHGTEIKQIAGRAGRMGMYDVGWYNAAEYKEDIIRKLGRKSHPVTRARLRIPESILAVDMPLSEILLRWGTIPDDGIFTKNTVEREVMLSRELEKLSTDKLLIYRFVTIPFSETRKELYDFWYALFESEVNEDRKSVFAYTGEIERRGSLLEDHELAYRKCDILYFYYDRFGVREDLEEIMRLKHDISADIMRILSDTGETEELTDDDPDDE